MIAMDAEQIQEFQDLVWDYYHQDGRELPWRKPNADGSFDPYKIIVSEIMLQQTQASRVVPKYHEFLQQFPSLEALSSASLADALKAWSGLGYNRRAKFLWEAARHITTQYQGKFPVTAEALVALPGIGANTAAAILAYAYNQPVVFIETNIRTVFIHHFFTDQDLVSDTQINPLIVAALDREHPREWYWALMDYGVHLKATIGNSSRSSKHYNKQSRFDGSKRQIRGQVIRLLTLGPKEHAVLSDAIPDDRLDAVLNDLVGEGLIQNNDQQYHL